MPDVALDPYSIYGHDGIITNGQVDNDATNDAFGKNVGFSRRSRCRCCSISDMMDGRVVAIRQALEETGHTNVGILSYAAKYASSFYGPFRSALDSAPKDFRKFKR